MEASWLKFLFLKTCDFEGNIKQLRNLENIVYFYVSLFINHEKLDKKTLIKWNKTKRIKFLVHQGK